MDVAEAFPRDPADFEDEALAATLAKLFDRAVRDTKNRIEYYDSRAKTFSLYARGLRRGAILLFILGTLAPTLGLLFARLEAAFGRPEDARAPPGVWGQLAALPTAEIGYVFLALAGGLILYDQFFGTSRSWMRFRQAETKLQGMVMALRYAWTARLAQDRGKVATAESIMTLTSLLTHHATAVESVAEAETREWAEQFRAQIEAFDQKVKTAQGEAEARSRRGLPPTGTRHGQSGDPDAEVEGDAGDAGYRGAEPFVPHTWRNQEEEGVL